MGLAIMKCIFKVRLSHRQLGNIDAANSYKKVTSSQTVSLYTTDLGRNNDGHSFNNA